MIRKIISGGQTGADTGGLIAAVRCNISTGGTMPRGWRTERGPNPELAALYGLVEHAWPEYPARTFKNITDADCTLVVANNLDGGSALTVNACLQLDKPVFQVRLLPLDSIMEVGKRGLVNWLLAHNHAIVNVAGNRESKAPGIEMRTTDFLELVFKGVNYHPGEAKC